MKKEILEALKAKFEGVSEKILGRIADNLAKTATTEEQVKAAVAGVTFQQVLDSYGDSRATEATQTAVTNYEKKHGLKDGKKVEQHKEPEKTGGDHHEDEIPAWAKSIIESNKSLSDQLSKMQGEKLTATRRQKLDEVIGKLPETLRKGYSRIQLSGMEDEEFNTLLTEVTAEVEAIGNETSSKGAVFGTPARTGGGSGGSKKEATDAEVNEVVDKIKI